jgi:hypothetical protein
VKTISKVRVKTTRSPARTKIRFLANLRSFAIRAQQNSGWDLSRCMGMNLRWNFALGLRRLHADRILPSATLYRLHLNSPLTAGPAGNFFMKSLKPIVPFFACIAIVAMGVLFSASSETNAPLRIFQFTYLTRIPTLPADAKLSRIWIPLPQSDRYQIVSALKTETPFAYTRHHDPEYGNEYLYLQVPVAKSHRTCRGARKL